MYRLLYRILTDVTIQSNKSKIMIVCNKQDKLMAKGSEVIKTLLEKELYVFPWLLIVIVILICIEYNVLLYFRDTLRLTKANQLESIDGKKNKTILGKKKKHFEFSHCQMPIEFTESSASQDVVLDLIKNWLEKIQ